MIFRDQRLDIGLPNNANIYVKAHMEELWKEHEENITVVHFAGVLKPWKGKCKDWFEDLCQEWREYGNDPAASLSK